MDGSFCVAIFFVLFVVSVLLQFQRARKRKEIVCAVNTSLFEAKTRQKWAHIDNSFDLLFKDFRKLQVIKKTKFFFLKL